MLQWEFFKFHAAVASHVRGFVDSTTEYVKMCDCRPETRITIRIMFIAK